jgi:hypothetical protein
MPWKGCTMKRFATNIFLRAKDTGKLMICQICKNDNVGQMVSNSLDTLQIHMAIRNLLACFKLRWESRSMPICLWHQQDSSPKWHQYRTWATKLCDFNDANEYTIHWLDQPMASCPMQDWHLHNRENADTAWHLWHWFERWTILPPIPECDNNLQSHQQDRNHIS